MHISMDKFVMADFDIEVGDELEVSTNCKANHFDKSLTIRFVSRFIEIDKQRVW